MDLDETLVHSSFEKVDNPDFILPVKLKNVLEIILKVKISGLKYDVYVMVRPGLDNFLEKVSKIFEVVIFTASLPEVYFYL